jgi:hypothetical protein
MENTKDCKSCKQDTTKNVYVIILGTYFLVSGIVVGVMIVKGLFNFF